MGERVTIARIANATVHVEQDDGLPPVLIVRAGFGTKRWEMREADPSPQIIKGLMVLQVAIERQLGPQPDELFERKK